ncbi:MAG: response regulator [Lachnospiraceae bacterium]|nr:response regulator [Lachnospiraceae bacterium]
MDTCIGMLRRLREYIVPKDAEIRVSAFNILAVCGIVVSLITAVVNAVSGNSPAVVLADLAGVVVSAALIVYCHRTGNYRMAMTMTAFIIFIGLFTALYLIQGGYHSGIPSFFIFGVVFTAFLLDGSAMMILIALELIWYISLIVYSYYHPPTLLQDEWHYMTRVVLDMSLVALSLAITMFFQIRVYRKKEQELSVAMQSADDANLAKSDFLAKMSHDIRTPLNTIMAMNELIVANTSSAKIREWVNDSNVSGRILMNLIDDMLDLTRIEAGRMELLEQPWDTAKLFNEMARTWRLQAERAGLSFAYHRDEKLPDYLIGDEDVIRKITDNLLSNAVKYTHSGCVTLAVRTEGQDLVLTVSDTGIGIAQEYLETIFKPFERGAQTLYRETSGSGLGLAIVKELVDAAHGTINCTSVVDEGTVFTVRIPQKGTSSAKSKSSAVRDRLPDAGALRQFIAPGAQILVVDDSPSNRKVIGSFLEPTLIKIDDVESGYEALEMLDIKEYDLILMDLRMPKMDGAETLARIREEYPDFQTPVVVLTADIMNGVRERLLGAGFADFLAKPVTSASLLEIVRAYLPDKIVSIEAPRETGLTLARVEGYQDLLRPYGIDLKMALEYNAGNADEFLMRADLFEQYADETMRTLRDPESREKYSLQVHSLKSIARGVGAHLLAQLAETDELRADPAYSVQIRSVMLDEYGRVRQGLGKLKAEVETI